MKRMNPQEEEEQWVLQRSQLQSERERDYGEVCTGREKLRKLARYLELAVPTGTRREPSGLASAR